MSGLVSASIVKTVVNGRAEEEQGPETPNGVSSRIFERVTECVLAGIGVQPEACAAYIPHFLPLYTQIILSLEAAQLHAMRPKSRSLLIRFMARVLCCHVYRQLSWDWEDHIGEQMPRGII